MKVSGSPPPPRWLFLRIETDEGVTGWGEPVVEGRAATVAAAVDELSDYLICGRRWPPNPQVRLVTAKSLRTGGYKLTSGAAVVDARTMS